MGRMLRIRPIWLICVFNTPNYNRKQESKTR